MISFLAKSHVVLVKTPKEGHLSRAQNPCWLIMSGYTILYTCSASIMSRIVYYINISSIGFPIH